VRYFDYENAAREANVTPEKLEELRRLIRQEFPKDEMMFELHLLRTCMAIKNGVLTLEDALRMEHASKQ
jgi:hypothetical protein